jgi:hydroxymethylbilane synthase
VKHQLESLHAGLTIELVGMDTQADEVHQNRYSTEPLQTLDGKNFFVKELDDALLAGQTDFSVHSYKDLSLDRPAALMVAAIPERENPRDIVLFRPDIRKVLATGRPLHIGSASPRRAQNTPAFLQSVLPQCPASPHGLVAIEMKPLRGNVTTRLRKLAEGQYDAIILAFAGLNRLGLNVADIRPFPRMILPLDYCPTAPAQGALALECRKEDLETQQILAALHHAPTALHIAREREVLQRYGGGCHQAFGATSIALAPSLPLTFIRGKSDAGELLNHLEFEATLSDTASPIRAWDGIAARQAMQTELLPDAILPENPASCFITHHRAVTHTILPQLLHAQTKTANAPVILYTSGVRSWQKLAAAGLWVEGCAENLGFEHLQTTLSAPLLALPSLEKWRVLTHQDGVQEWHDSPLHPLATYRILPSATEKDGIAQATHLYWGSGSQFLRLRHLTASHAIHCCGAGKTAQTLRHHGTQPVIFPTVQEWRSKIATILA